MTALGSTTATGIDPTYGVSAPITTGAARTIAMEAEERERRRLEALQRQELVGIDFMGGPRPLEGVANPGIIQSQTSDWGTPQIPRQPTQEGVDAFGIADSTLKTLGTSQDQFSSMPASSIPTAPGTFESLGASLGGKVDDTIGAAQGIGGRLLDIPSAFNEGVEAFNPRAFGQRQMEELENLRPADTGGQSLFGGGGFGSLNPREVGRRVIEDRRRAEELNRRRSKDLFSGFY